MSQDQRRLAAIMFTDMVGYTALTQSDESKTMDLLRKQDALLRPCFPKFNGREVKSIGDSFLVEFESALDALRCAAEVQAILHDYNETAGDGWRVVIRVGVHLGDVIHRDGDVFGDAVNISSRIEPLAEPGGVCVSRQVYDQVRNKFNLPFVSLGEKELKNVSSPVEVFRVKMPWESKPPQERRPEGRRVAVLPFSNMSPEPGDEYFADGMTEELISTVSRIEGAEVISRTSVMQYKKAVKPIREISRELDAGTVLEGSVRKAGNKLRVTVQMIDAVKDRHVWAESYDRDMNDVFAIQTDIAARVADALRARMSDSSPAAAGSTGNPDAYTVYLRAMSLCHEGAESSQEEAIALLESAVDRDPSFAKAYALLAETYRHLGYFGDYAGSLAKAERAARKALEVGPEIAETHSAMASVDMGLDRFQEARRELEEAVRLNPNLSDAYRLLGEVEGAFGRLQASEANFRRAYALDPLSSIDGILLSQVLLIEGKKDESSKILGHMRELYPHNYHLQDAVTASYLITGDYGAAWDAIESGLRDGRGNTMLQAEKAVYFALQGKRDDADEAIRDIGGGDASSTLVLQTSFVVSALLKDYDRAFAFLDQLADAHAWGFLIKTDPFLGELRKDPRFAKFCIKVGIPV
ncbi:MAG: hypothetical protein JRN21_05370 [Nitrososphaerota archaeon]|nr:hypothetical protein [Nitrososphaerota archaeon]